MSKRNLGRARGLNSIADPSDFKGKAGRPPQKTPKKPKETPDHTQDVTDTSPDAPQDNPESTTDLTNGQTSPATKKSGSRARRTGAKGKSDSSTGSESDLDQDVDDSGVDSAEGAGTDSTDSGASSAPGRRNGRGAALTKARRIRRELSVPIVVADAVESTGINPADLVMNAFRKHSDGVYSGTGARLAAKGRKRLRISLSDGDFDKITRLGESRNWNRSETVSVLLSLDLLADSTADGVGL